MERVLDAATLALDRGDGELELAGLELVEVTPIRYDAWERQDGAERPIRIEAWLAVPTRAREDARVPGVVAAHGLGGRAERGYALRLAGRLGMAVLTYSGPGQGDSGGHGTDDPARLWDTVPDPRESWFWGHTLAAMRGLSVLEAIPEVDAGRLGLIGGSGGAIATLLANGVDARIRAAVPVSGCGDLGAAAEHGGWQNDLLDEAGLDRHGPEYQAFLAWLDPIQFAPSQHGATLLINGTQDEFFPLDSTDATFAAMPAGPHRLALIFNWDHGWFSLDAPHMASYDHSEEAGEITNESMDTWLLRHLSGFGAASPLPEVPTAALESAPGAATLSARLETGWTVRRVRAAASIDRAWTFVDAELDPQPALGPGVWGKLIPTPGAQYDDTNTAYFVEFELAPSLGRRIFLTSRPHLPAGFAPRIRPIPQ